MRTGTRKPPTIKKLGEAYQTYRAQHKVRESIKLVAQHFGLSRQQVCEMLQFDPKWAEDKED